MNRLRGLMAITAAGALVLGAPWARVEASPFGPLFAGGCTLVDLTLVTNTNSDVILSADAGSTCAEFDQTQLDLHSVGPLSMSGEVTSCTTSPVFTVSALVTFAPAGNPNYPPVGVTLTGGAATLKSAGIPPAFVGSGAFTFDGGDCSAATWSLGTIAYEDPDLS